MLCSFLKRRRNIKEYICNVINNFYHFILAIVAVFKTIKNKLGYFKI